jgi:cyclic pyranopterin phosphate synthase
VSLVQIRPHAIATGPDPLVDRVQRRVRYLRVSLTDRCNYRCTYCMPDRELDYGARAELLTLEEVAELCAAFARWGVRRVRLTGGEPTLRRGLVDLVAALTKIDTDEGRPLEVVLTTNGERLADLVEPLHAAGLRGLTVSLDTLDAARFSAITRRGDLHRVRAGLAAAAATWGPDRIKLNTVVMRGFNDDELGALARFAWSHAAVPRFIELMPMSSGELYAPGELLAAAEIRARLAADLGAVVVADDGGPAKGAGPSTYWRVGDRRFGTIAAMTENFCASCNRLRLSATGQLHACLARDETGDLRSAVRSRDPNRVETVVRAALGTKRDTHGFNMDGTGGPAKAMVSIGG